MSGGGNRSSIPPHILEIIKKYNIGQGRKARKSRLLSKPKLRTRKSFKLPVGLNPSFIAPINLKNDPKTGQFKDSGYVTVPSNFRKSILPQRFPNAKEGDYYQIKMTNLTTKNSGIDTCKLKSRGRLYFSQNLYHYFNYKPGDQIKFEFQKHFPLSQKGQFSSVKTISRFVMPKNSGNMFRVYIPMDAKIFTGLDTYQPDLHVHWTAREYQGAGRQYYNTEIGIKPVNLDLMSKPQSFYDQFNILNINLTSLQINQLNNSNNQKFVESYLRPISDATGIPLHGYPQVEKEKLGQYLINDLARKGYFYDIERFEFGHQIRHEDGRLLKPDALAFRRGNAEPITNELKMHSQNTYINSQRSTKQSSDYSGFNANLITTASKRNISKEIQSNYNRIIDYEDLSKMVDSSGDPLHRQILDIIRTPWPTEDETSYFEIYRFR